MLTSIVRKEEFIMLRSIFFLIICFCFFSNIRVVSQESNEVLSVEEYLSLVNANLLRNRGNRFTVRSTVIRVRHNPWGVGDNYFFSISVRDPHSRNSIEFFLHRNSLDSISSIEPNDIVTISGIVYNSHWLTNAMVIGIEKNNPPFQIRPLYSFEEIFDIRENRMLLIDGERLRFTGRVYRIDRNNLGDGYVVIIGDNWMRSLHCVFSSQYREVLLGLNSGDIVTVEGTFRMISGGRRGAFHDCVIIIE